MLRSALPGASRRLLASKAAASAAKARKPAPPQSLADFGSRVFDLKANLSPATLAALEAHRQKGAPLGEEFKSEVATKLRAWAFKHGAVNISHWFSPMRNSYAEKHDSLLDIDFKTGAVSPDLTASRIFKGETDGSSFPNGGMRQTSSAAAYTAWDLTSPPFIRDDTVYVPAAFVSFLGDPLDDKTPLLRSMDAVRAEGLRLLRNIGDKESKDVVSNVGWEQEFFVIDRDNFDARPDLVHCDRTLLGALPHRGQQMEQNYFAQMNVRTRAYLRDVQKELWALGISINTLHNEVAPAQHEISPVFSLVSVASDTNMICMEVMREKAAAHGLAVLFHEKPFAGVNGSGKHNNWGLNTDSGANLFVPGKTVEEQRRFVAFVSALARSVRVHGDVMRIACSSPHNDHRLGAQEAPPGIMSLYTGPNLEAHLRKVIGGGPLEGYGLKSDVLDLGTRSVLPISKPVEDRNRTAPFPFCGNRFEFRAVGASQSIAWPLALINTIMADGMADLSSRIEKGKSVQEAVKAQLSESMDAVFNGNGYSSEWHEEAVKRGLLNLRTSVDALERFDSPKNRELFQRHGIFDPKVLAARTDVLYHQYVNTVRMEAATMLDMLNTRIIPAIADDIRSFLPAMDKYNKIKNTKYQAVIDTTIALEETLKQFPADADHHQQALFCRDSLRKQMTVVRAAHDAAETSIPAALYPFPRYEQILYEHHSEGVRR